MVRLPMKQILNATATGQPGGFFEINRRGFTLMELMIVLIIASLTVALVLPRVGAGWKRMEDREFLQEFVETIKRARLRAMSSGRITAFRINGAERLYDLAVPLSRPIPPNVDIYSDRLEQDTDTGDHMMIFYPDGSLIGSDVEITFDRQRTFRISIHPILGTVRLSQVNTR